MSFLVRQSNPGDLTLKGTKIEVKPVTNAPQVSSKNTLFVGAGGGGDTAAAIFRAISSDIPTENKFVLGAGYSRQDYKNTLTADESKKEGKPYYRKEQPEDKVDSYLNSILIDPAHSDNENCEVYRLKVNDVKLDDMFGSEVNTKDGKKKYESADAGFKYKTLLEEVLCIKKLQQVQEINEKIDLNNIFMCFTTPDVKESNTQNLKKMYNSIKWFLNHFNIRKVVLMDFGGDIFDFKQIARDTLVLTMITHILTFEKNLKEITLDIEVYGPGVDSHETLEHVNGNLNAVVKALGGNVVTNTTLGSERLIVDNLVKLFTKDVDLKNVAKFINLSGPGRATGNYIRAHEIVNNKTGQEDFVQEYLRARTEVKTFVDESNMVIPETVTKAFSKAKNEEDKIVIGSDTYTSISLAYKILLQKYDPAFANAYFFSTKGSDLYDKHLQNLPVAASTWAMLNSNTSIQQAQTGGKQQRKSKSPIKTDKKITLGNKQYVVYQGARGAKYVKKRGEFCSLRKRVKNL